MAEPDPKFLLREVLTEMSAGESDLGSMADTLPALTEFLSAFATPDFVCIMRGLPPTPPTTHPGVEGVLSAWNDYGEAFESVRAELEGIRESETHIVVLVNQVATTRHQGVEISQPSAMVFAFEGARVSRVEFHLDRDAAMRSAGLEPGSDDATA